MLHFGDVEFLCCDIFLSDIFLHKYGVEVGRRRLKICRGSAACRKNVKFEVFESGDFSDVSDGSYGKLPFLEILFFFTFF